MILLVTVIAAIVCIAALVLPRGPWDGPGGRGPY